MKATIIYSRLNNPTENYVGPNSSQVTLLAETDLSALGIFALQFSSMISYPVKSYGKIKHSYQIEIWGYQDKELNLIETLYFNTKAECLKRFKQGNF
jgi:hypothetical protein